MVRTAHLDADNRREPKTDHFCVRCHKDLKPGQPFRWVRPTDWSFAQVMHADDAGEEVIAATERGEYPGCFPVGMDCARKIGLEFSHSPA